MKLIYNFEIMEIGDGFNAVPVGDNAAGLHGILELNDVGAAMLRLIQESQTPEEVHQKLCAQYPDDDPNDIGQKLCDFLNQLIRERLLIP